MEELAELTDRGRSTIHRLEHGPATKTGAVEQPTPCSVACVMVALQACEEEVRPLVGDGTWGDDVLRWIPLVADPRGMTSLGRSIFDRLQAVGHRPQQANHQHPHPSTSDVPVGRDSDLEQATPAEPELQPPLGVGLEGDSARTFGGPGTFGGPIGTLGGDGAPINIDNPKD